MTWRAISAGPCGWGPQKYIPATEDRFGDIATPAVYGKRKLMSAEEARQKVSSGGGGGGAGGAGGGGGNGTRNPGVLGLSDFQEFDYAVVESSDPTRLIEDIKKKRRSEVVGAKRRLTQDGDADAAPAPPPPPG
jgi:hypothetical protein